MSVENDSYKQPYLSSEVSPYASDRLKRIYEKAIAEGNPTSSREVKQPLVEQDLSIYDRYLNRYPTHSRINFIELYDDLGTQVGDVVDIAQNVYTDIRVLETEIAENPHLADEQDIRRDLLNAHRNYFNNLADIVRPQIDVRALLTRKEQVDIELDPLRENITI